MSDETPTFTITTVAYKGLLSQERISLDMIQYQVTLSEMLKLLQQQLYNFWGSLFATLLAFPYPHVPIVFTFTFSTLPIHNEALQSHPTLPIFA